MNETGKDSNGEASQDRNTWVRFEDEETKQHSTETNSDAAVLPVENGSAIVSDPLTSSAVIDTEHAQVNFWGTTPRIPPPPPSSTTSPTALETVITVPPTNDTVSNKAVHPVRPTRPSRNVIRQGFANGDVIVSVLPVNEKCSWLTKADFRPELVPEELMAEGLTLTVEDYVSALEILVNDLRFSCYTICYKRALLVWILLCFTVLMSLLFSEVRGLILFGAGIVWLILNAGGIFICMWLKIKLNANLEKCLAQINKYLIKHKILMGVDDRGKLSCHKVHLIFIYFDCGDCIRKLNDLIDNDPELRTKMESGQNKNGISFLQPQVDVDNSDIIITGSNTRISRRQERGERLLLRYSQRWVKGYVRRMLDLCVDVHIREEGSQVCQPRHCISARCPCQFIEEHLAFKTRGKCCGCQWFDF